MTQQGYGPVRYSIDFDRGVIIEDRRGEVFHKYVDEPFWRDAQGIPVPQEQTETLTEELQT